MRIVVADDHPLFRIALIHSLRGITGATPPIEAASLSTLEEAVRANADLDLILLDLHMPGARGFSSLVFLRGERPEVPVVVISSNDHPRTIRRVMDIIWSVRSLERIGDHATNIAEIIHYEITGEELATNTRPKTDALKT